MSYIVRPEFHKYLRLTEATAAAAADACSGIWILRVFGRVATTTTTVEVVHDDDDGRRRDDDVRVVSYAYASAYRALGRAADDGNARARSRARC